MCEDLWSTCVIDAYEPVENEADWLSCPKCRVKPRVWEFDNGRYAKCLCRSKYESAPVSAESIMSVIKRTGGVYEYDRDDLRKAWNLYVEGISKS